MIKTIKAKLLVDIGITHGFTERTGGVSVPPTDSLNVKVSSLVPDSVQNVSKNLGMIIRETSKNFDKGTILYLEGGDNVTQQAKLDGFQTLYGYDGIVTRNKNSMLAITIADCLPILLADKANGVIGISHAGWKGSAGRITTKVVNEMIKLGAKPADISAAIGPGICKKCYEVGEEIIDNFIPEVATNISDDKYLLDLVKSNIDELEVTGVNRIEHLDICTYENTDRFFSARKDEPTGRFLAYISLGSA